jgi:hypothetical protein
LAGFDNVEAHKVQKNEVLKVVSYNDKDNTVTAKDKAGKEVTFNPSDKASQYLQPAVAENRKYSVGDTVLARANIGDSHVKDKDGNKVANSEQVKNGELGVITKVNDKGVEIKWGDSEKAHKHSNEDMRQVDHGYAQTSYAAQGKTQQYTIVALDKHDASGLNDRQTLVNLTRSKLDTDVIATKDANFGNAGQQAQKSTAIEVQAPSPVAQKQPEQPEQRAQDFKSVKDALDNSKQDAYKRSEKDFQKPEAVKNDERKELDSKRNAVLSGLEQSKQEIKGTKIEVPKEDRAEAKELGAKYCEVQKSYVVPEKLDLEKFSKWLDKEKDADKGQDKERVRENDKTNAKEKEFSLSF